ncbi:MAG TPA: SPOR domain-containing protein [Burkholderiales bacterium]
MRAVFLLLVLANLALFAWSRYGAPDVPSVAAQSRQVEPEKLKVIAPKDLPAPVAKKEKLPEKPAPSLACVEWGSFTLADTPRAQQALEPLALGERLAQKRTEEVARWWVFIPPQGSRQGALKKAAELNKLGVEEFFIVQEEGEHRWAVSLGIFRSEDAAQARLAALRTQGVRSARVGPRETVVPKIWLQVKSVDAPLQTRLREIARQVEGSELRDCRP